MIINISKYGFILTALLAAFLHLEARADISDILQPVKLSESIKEELAELDINFSADLGDVDLAHGLNLSAKYRYEVEPSYQNQYYTRIDKWDVKTNLNVGDLIPQVIDTPLTFSIAKANSLFFVRQFKSKLEAMGSSPYSPKRLPLNDKKALSELSAGDFVSIPAQLTIAVGAGVGTATVAPVVLGAKANVYYVISGEFTIQVFKIDETHVRLKMISKRGYDRGVTTNAGASFKFFGIRILDRQVDRLFDRDLVQLGYSINPGAQFILDYVFDLSNAEAAAAYNQILGSTLKFRDVVVLNDLNNARELKDKLISNFDKAEKIFEADKEIEPGKRRVSRIFKGFNNYTGHTNHLKLALLVTSFTNDRTYTENKITYIDKNENNLEFFYPTYSRYMETKLGKWFFELKDQSFQNNFGLIPRYNSEDASSRDPDFGLTFERKDKIFSSVEQKAVQKFMIGQLPEIVGSAINLDEWKSGHEKRDSRIFFQLILKAQGFDHLRQYSRKELKEKLVAYVMEKKKLHVLDNSDSTWEKLKDFLFLSKYIKNEQVRELGDKLFESLSQPHGQSEVMLKKLIKLNEHGIFDKIGVGFLISLLPQKDLKDLVYIKLEMLARDLKPIAHEFGRMNYKNLYKELNVVQSRISNRSYDLRITPADQDLGEKEYDDENLDINALLRLN